MATNTNKQQINVFNKGMNTDTSDAYISSDQYREAVNLRFLMNNDSTTGELHTIEGWKDLGLDFYNVLATTSIRNYGIIIEGTPDEWNIWRWDKDQDKSNTNPKKVFGPCEDPIGEKISLVTRWESDENVKLYIADGIHNLMSINIMDKGDVQTDIKYITNISEDILEQISVQYDQEPGYLLPAVIQYAYVLYNEGGTQSDISPLSEPVSLYEYKDGFATNGFAQDTITGRSLHIELNIPDPEYKKIKVYRITYVQNGQQPQIDVIYDTEFSGNLDFVDRGINLYTISYADFISQTKINFKPVLIESKNDYLFAGNIVYDNIDVDSKFAGIRDEDITWQFVYSWHTLSKDSNGVLDVNERSLKRGEKYRYGAVFYDNLNRKSSVRWIADIDVPEWGADDVQCETFNTSYRPSEDEDASNPGEVNVRTVGIRFTINNLPDDCSGYEIVRCKRTPQDSKTLFQGIIGRAIGTYDDTKELDLSYATPIFTMEPILEIPTINGNNFNENPGVNYSSNHYARSSRNMLMFACPEYCYQSDDVKNIIDTYKQNNNLYLKFIQDYSINNTDDQLTYADWRYGIAASITVDYKKVGEGIPAMTYTLDNTGQDWVFDQAQYVRYYSGGARLNIDPDDVDNTFEGITTRNIYIDDKIVDKTGTKQNVIYTQIMFPYGEADYFSGREIDVSNVGYADSPEYNTFNSGDNITIANQQSVAGTKTFINWDAKTFLYTGVFSETDAAAQYDKEDYKNGIPGVHSPVTAGSKCILLNTPNVNLTTALWLKEYPYPISVVDLRKRTYVPYGGTSDVAKQNSIYYSFGNYKKHESSSDTIEVFDGDCYINIFEFISGHAWFSDRYNGLMMPTIYRVPIESSIDLQATYGDLYTRLDSNKKYYIQDKGPVSINGFTQNKPAYLYNTAYNVVPGAVTYSPIKYTEISTDKFDTRILYSKPKTNGEQIDSWTQFQAANFIDVDTRFGQLTELRLFKDALLFWQESATGVLSVNERTILQDANDTNIILGNGDVLQRYDYLTTEFGMKPGQFADTQSNTTLYWWDGYKKDIVAYSGGQQVVPMKKIKTVNKYINENDECEKPVLAYDSKYNEVLMNVVAPMPLAYSEITQQFTSLYNASFDYKVNFNDRLILVANDNFNEWNAGSGNLKPSLKYVVNDNNTYVKVYDNVLFGLGDVFDDGSYFYNSDVEEKIQPLNFTFKTKGQESTEQVKITNREYDYKFAIPRNKGAEYADRLRGKTMKCELTTNDDVNSADFSIQYIITKYRISWS